MADNVYEGLFIFDAGRFARDRVALPTGLEEQITTRGGDVMVSRIWEERRLAYPINGQRKGVYWLMYFRLDSQALADVTRYCHQNDGVLRELFVKLNPRLVEEIIAHAKGQESAEAPGEDAGATNTEQPQPVASEG